MKSALIFVMRQVSNRGLHRDKRLRLGLRVRLRGLGGGAEDFQGWAVEDAAVGEEAGDDGGGTGDD